MPILYLVAEDDTALPLDGMVELFERTRATKRMVILRRADHGHFADIVEPQAGLCPADQAHLAIRGLTLCDLDATLREQEAAQQFWAADVAAELALRGIDVIVHNP